MRSWSNDELVEYVSRFNGEQRDYVLKKLMECSLLEDFLGTTEGRLILDSVVESISSNIGKMVHASCNETEGLYDLAVKVRVAYEFMYSLAKTAEAGKEHITKMKKK